MVSDFTPYRALAWEQHTSEIQYQILQKSSNDRIFKIFEIGFIYVIIVTYCVDDQRVATRFSTLIPAIRRFKIFSFTSCGLFSMDAVFHRFITKYLRSHIDTLLHT